MSQNVQQQRKLLQSMTLPELQRRYAEVFGEPTRTRHKQSLVRRILWRLQALAEGDLSQRARRRAEALANDADLRIHPPKTTVPTEIPAARDRRLPEPGTVITRLYKGRLLEVCVLADGFAHDGERFASLSAVAKHITGSHCNGYHFFGFAKQGDAG